MPLKKQHINMYDATSFVEKLLYKMYITCMKIPFKFPPLMNQDRKMDHKSLNIVELRILHIFILPINMKLYNA